MEMDARKLHLGEGCSSLFTLYCTQVLHFSEHAAYGRIEAARAARRFPAILEHLADGRLTLTAIGLLAAHLTPANCEEVLSSAAYKSKRDVERIVAAIRPQPPVPSVVRKLAPPRTPSLPAPRAVAALGGSTGTGSCTTSAEQTMSPAPVDQPLLSAPLAAPRRDQMVVTPLAPERYKVQFTISRQAHDKLRRAQDLLRHTIPDGNPAVVFERCADVAGR